MSLAAALANASNPRTRRTRLDEIWDALDEADRATLLDWMINPKVQHLTIADALTSLGHPVHRTTIGEARRIGWANNKETS